LEEVCFEGGSLTDEDGESVPEGGGVQLPRRPGHVSFSDRYKTDKYINKEKNQPYSVFC